MNESKILRTASDAQWYAHAYSEYLADVAQTTSNLMAALQEVLTYDTISMDQVQVILTSHGIDPQARFIIGSYGSISALTLAMNSWYDTDLPDGYESSHDYTIEELFSIIRGTWTQCVISSKAFSSYASNAKDSISRVSNFLQELQANFSIDDSVRDTVSYYQSMINASPTVENFVSIFISATGVDDAEQSDDPMAYINSDVYKYTGNTPGIALDFSTVNKAINSTVSVAANAIKGVFNVVRSGVSWLFSKAKKYVVDTVIDPAVCEYIGTGDDNEGYIDGFAWYGEFVPNVTYSHFNTGGQISSLFSGFYDSYAEKWIKIKLKVGEFLFRIISDDVKWQCYFKPVAVDVDYFKENYSGSTLEPTYSSNNHTQSLEDYNTWLTHVIECIQPVSKDATKEQIYTGLAFSNALTGSIAMFAFIETFGIVTGSNILNATNSGSYLTDLSDYYTFDPALESNQVTNAKILMAAAGDPGDADNIHNCLHYNEISGVSLVSSVYTHSVRAMMTDIISVWALCRKERSQYPTNYTFVPYSNNHVSFSPASWRIKNDAEIAETRDNFIEKAILAAVVVTALVFIGITAVKISKNAFFKRQQTLGQLENKMWNGQKLTASEKKKYISYNRKQNASKWLSSGVQEPTTSLSNDSQTIIELIQG